MRERLVLLTQQLSTRLAPVAARLEPRLARVNAAARRAGAWLARALRSAIVGAKFALDRTLVLVERALLSPRWRERLHASSVFALIFAFGVASVDMLIAGGPELIASARAATAHAPRVDLIAATTGGGAEIVQMAALEFRDADTVVPEERAAAIRPTALRPEAQPLAALPDLADTPTAPIKAEPEVRDIPDPRIKAEV